MQPTAPRSLRENLSRYDHTSGVHNRNLSRVLAVYYAIEQRRAAEAPPGLGVNPEDTAAAARTALKSRTARCAAAGPPDPENGREPDREGARESCPCEGAGVISGLGQKRSRKKQDGDKDDGD